MRDRTRCAWGARAACTVESHQWVDTSAGAAGGRRTGSRRSVAGALSVSILAASALFAGAAYAGNATATAKHAAVEHISAAQDQYGRHHVIKPVAPPATHVLAHQAVKKPAAAPTTHIVVHHAVEPVVKTPYTVVPVTPTVTPTITPAVTPVVHAASPAQTLPFTGLSLLKVVLVGLGLLCLGVVLRRRRQSHD